jgi:antitoxin CptB
MVKLYHKILKDEQEGTMQEQGSPAVAIHSSRAIRWQCRRGMLELDLILLKYFDHYYEKLEPSQQRIFVQLLEQPDQTLYQWFTGQTLPGTLDLKFIPLVETIRKNLWNP